MNGKPAEMQTDDHDHHAEAAGNRADAAEDVVTIPRAEFEALRAAAAPEAPRGDREADADRRLAELDRKAAAWEHAYKAAVRDRELAAALAGTPLVPGAAPQLIRLWREDLDVTEEDGRTTVTARDGRPVDRAVADWLARPEYAHFRPPGTRGGTATTGGRRDAAPPAAPPAARTLGESLVARWREAAAPEPAPGSAPVGLGRRRP